MIILAAIAVFGLLFLILNGIASDITSNYKKRALINLIFGVINLVGFMIIYFVDKQYEQKYSFFDYMSFIGAITLYTLILFITLYKKGYNNRQKMFGRIKLTTDKKEYLYLVCRCENDIYLEKEKHSGFVIKLDKKDFHDEKIINFVRKYSLIINDDNFIKIGEYILKPKKGKDIFYQGSTDKELPVSAALNDLNTNKVSGVGITKIQSISQADHDALTEKDPATLYIINN